jgi:two-component system sensor histidine kinase DegS
MGYKIQFCKELLNRNPELLTGQFDSLIENINHAIDQSREIISSLRPDLIDTMGLVPALNRYIENFMQETDIRVIMHLPKRVKLSSGIRICLFRVAQEALMNVYKHAETKMAEVSLKQDKENIFLIIEDQGRGFNPSQRHFGRKDQGTLGLLSMKERLEVIGGTLAIHTGLNKGCRIEAKIPLSDEVS